MGFRLFFLLMWTSLLGIQCHDTDFAILEKIAAAASTCKYSRLSEVCKGKDCAALSGQCYCDDKCHNKPEGCCIDVNEVKNGQRALVNQLAPPKASNCSMLPKSDNGGCDGGPDMCTAFIPGNPVTTCYCHEHCFSKNYTCCKDIYRPYNNCSALITTNGTGFCDEEPKDCVVQPGEEFCYCDIKCVTDENRKCCDDLVFPKNCSMIASKRDMYGFCMGGPNKCAAKPDGEEYCYCDVGCVSDENRKCCKDLGCSHGNDQTHGISQPLVKPGVAPLMNTATGMLEMITFIREKYDELRRYLKLFT